MVKEAYLCFTVISDKAEPMWDQRSQKAFKVVEKKRSVSEGYFKEVSQHVPAVIGIKCMMGKQIRFVCWEQNTKCCIFTHLEFFCGLNSLYCGVQGSLPMSV